MRDTNLGSVSRKLFCRPRASAISPLEISPFLRAILQEKRIIVVINHLALAAEAGTAALVVDLTIIKPVLRLQSANRSN